MIELSQGMKNSLDRLAGSPTPADDEYIDSVDGLLHCKCCGGSRQLEVPSPWGKGTFRPRCLCPCQEEAEQRKREAEKLRQRLERVRKRKAEGLQDRYLHDFTFDKDDGQNPNSEKARAYVENWKTASQENIGLLFFGKVGTGKTFLAGCIANALIERDVPVNMTSIPKILNRIYGAFPEDRCAILNGLDEYDLLILDDFGVERKTGYAMEQVFSIIDNRYKLRKPMIITTNLSLDEIKNPPDLDHARIYDRILERCAPLLFAGKNYRSERAEVTKATAREIVNPATGRKEPYEQHT